MIKKSGIPSYKIDGIFGGKNRLKSNWPPYRIEKKICSILEIKPFKEALHFSNLLLDFKGEISEDAARWFISKKISNCI